MHLTKYLQSVRFPSAKGTTHFSRDLMRKYSVGGNTYERKASNYTFIQNKQP